MTKKFINQIIIVGEKLNLPVIVFTGTLPLPPAGIQQLISANGIVAQVPNLTQSPGKDDRMGPWESGTRHRGDT